MATTKDDRIGELEDQLKERDRRIQDLRADLDKKDALVSEMREHVEKADELIDSWIEGFEMVLDDDGKWSHEPWIKEADETVDRYNALLREWNRFVPEYNATIAPRSIGRPLQASEVQCRQVLKLHKAGTSLRAIAGETSLSLRTVRTIVDKGDQRDSASKRTNLLRRRELNRAKQASWRARKRTRDALPARINEIIEEGRALVRRARTE